MLPDFPSLRKFFDEAAFHRIDTMARRQSPVLSKIRGITQHEGIDHSFHQEGTGTVTQAPEQFQIPVEIKLEEIPTLVGERLVQKLDAIAYEQTKRQSELFYRRLREDSEKVGNSIDAEGQPLSQDMALEMLRRIEWTPDHVFLAHPVMAESMGRQWKEWQKDRAFMKRYEELQSRKKEEWRDRESDRKLAD